ncbi:DUF995 domain-containing protein [Azohydromonas lata]|uniref:DUF995 domain-containing protein n=1 Tax=Azohydromonas lata TaxID=45677 RepID=UPI000836AC64|nr:DUF995 domain-containing protein [Azohydromonas lata]
MHRSVIHCAGAAALLIVPVLAPAQEQISELAAQSPHQLSKEELQTLWPGASVSRVSARGNTHRWSNDADGTFIISSDNAAPGMRASSSAHGRWRILDDGRLCVTIEWRLNPTEDWCRFVFRTGDGYWTARSDASGEKVYRLEIRRPG